MGNILKIFSSKFLTLSTVQGDVGRAVLEVTPSGLDFGRICGDNDEMPDLELVDG